MITVTGTVQTALEPARAFDYLSAFEHTPEWDPGTPVVDKLSTEMIKAINDPEVKSKLVAQGIEPSGMTPTELSAFQKSEIDKWARVIKAGNIKIE